MLLIKLIILFAPFSRRVEYRRDGITAINDFLFHKSGFFFIFILLYSWHTYEYDIVSCCRFQNPNSNQRLCFVNLFTYLFDLILANVVSFIPASIHTVIWFVPLFLFFYLICLNFTHTTMRYLNSLNNKGKISINSTNELLADMFFLFKFLFLSYSIFRFEN